jgi:hypothetical protein
LIAAHQEKATPFVWTTSADEILASIARFAQRTLDFQAAASYSPNHAVRTRDEDDA